MYISILFLLIIPTQHFFLFLFPSIFLQNYLLPSFTCTENYPCTFLLEYSGRILLNNYLPCSPRYELVLEHVGQIVAVLGKRREEILKFIRETARRADVHGKNAFGNIRRSSLDDLMTIRHRGRCHKFTRNFNKSSCTTGDFSDLQRTRFPLHSRAPRGPSRKLPRAGDKPDQRDPIADDLSSEKRRDLDQRWHSSRAPPRSSQEPRAARKITDDNFY